MRASVAFVTKSYSPDLERCELLCRSVELLAPGTRHWIIVDSRDREAFRTLEGPRTTIVTTEELLGRRLQQFVVPFRTGRNLWIGPRTPPVRSWLVQQLAKLALSSGSSARARARHVRREGRGQGPRRAGSAKTGVRPADYGEVFERRWQKALAEE